MFGIQMYMMMESTGTTREIDRGENYMNLLPAYMYIPIRDQTFDKTICWWLMLTFFYYLYFCYFARETSLLQSYLLKNNWIAFVKVNLDFVNKELDYIINS